MVAGPCYRSKQVRYVTSLYLSDLHSRRKNRLVGLCYM